MENVRRFFCRVAADALPGLRSVRPAGNLFTILAGPSPGVQGAAATGRPLCAPCAMPGITQTINRERNVR
ncbi:DNA helicase [Klebsiella pneumoniae subsp. pneumoniae]|nr:DNA helicase [Klebsiella pneumoniae]PZA40451.1 DNA helicase [Klebsiella pneumoniae subsp. pneumoniae]AZZ34839.1 DNA helicase [Klebsiella pneumoniae]MBM5757579.1 DNA helicase [Klebsiella pneumoniae]OVG39521.1 hypothetical protein B5L94_03675 [Klebsiella pneumoniae]